MTGRRPVSRGERLYWRVRALAFRFGRRLAGSRRRIIREIDYRGAAFFIFANEDLGWRLIRRHEFERLELEALEPLIQSGDTCADVGANIGLYTVFMARRCPQGRVVAFEPLVGNINLLRRNLAANGLTNVDVVSGVLSDEGGEVQFSVAEDGAFSSIRRTGRRREDHRERVASTTLDDVFFLPRRRLDVLKIDVEGAERLVLQGGQRLLSDPEMRPRAILVELSAKNQRVYGYVPEDVVRFLEKLGYQGHAITDNGLLTPWTRDSGSEDGLFLLKREDATQDRSPGATPFFPGSGLARRADSGGGPS